jgi:RNA polymerase sigma-70 factor (ECF subfamily)
MHRLERERAVVDGEVTALLGEGKVAEAATRALRAYGPRILAYFRTILRGEEPADEAFAEFTEDFWKGLPGFRGESAFRTWVYQVAHNTAAQYARDPFRRRARRLETEQMAGLAAEIRESTLDYLRTTMKQGVARLRAELQPEEQALLVLRIDQAMPWRDVARVLGGDEATLRKRFERIKERLRKLALAEGLFTPSRGG